jgi:cysteine desulfurase
MIAVEELRRAMGPETILVSIMAANNEIGVLAPLEDIGKICREHGVVFHSDGAQAVGKIPMNVGSLNLDLLSISGHKMYGPKGVGALWVRSGLRLAPLIDGGGHEHGMRSGTLNVPGIVGLGKACEICGAEMTQESERLTRLRDRLKDAILRRVDEVRVNGSLEHRLPGNLNLSVGYVDAESLQVGLRGVAFSSGSACSSDKVDPSHVLKAIGVPNELAASTLRFGLGRFNTEAEVDYVADRLCAAVEQLRELSPEYESRKAGTSS